MILVTFALKTSFSEVILDFGTDIQPETEMHRTLTKTTLKPLLEIEAKPNVTSMKSDLEFRLCSYCPWPKNEKAGTTCGKRANFLVKKHKMTPET